MSQNDPQVPWTDEQWARVQQVIQEEASRARVAATFLPLVGPLPASTDFVREEEITAIGNDPDLEGALVAPQTGISVADRDTIRLKTLQVRVYARGAQLADPEMTSMLSLFRRAANYLARLEDAVIFNGERPKGRSRKMPAVGEIRGGEEIRGLLSFEPGLPTRQVTPGSAQSLVAAVSRSIGDLEGEGYFGPFAVVLGQELFATAQTPDARSLVLPQDRIIPFLGGGPLLRSSLLPDNYGVVVALGGAPVELVVAKDVSLSFMQITPDPAYVFRIYERMALRIKQPRAIVALLPPPAAPTVTTITPPQGPIAGGQSITITGTNLLEATEVTFDGSPATDVEVRDDTTIVAKTPRVPKAGKVTVQVKTRGGTGNGEYTYV
jgi:uncharacterized linocin/CFP29 family protein